jgi:hypothetical protein
VTIRSLFAGVFCWWLALLAGAGVMAETPSQSQPYDAKGKPDPFVALVREGRFVGTRGTGASASSISDLQLAGILWDPAGYSLALINETEVAVGDMVGSYQVMEIRPDAVVLMREGKAAVLQLLFEKPGPSSE